MLTLVTTTYNRPLSFSLLERWVGAQTLRPDQWLVVNDSPPTTEYVYTAGQQVVQRRRRQQEGPSICENWLAAIPLVEGSAVIVAEDDDYLHATWCARMVEALATHEIVGVHSDVYYDVARRLYRRCGNQTHASLGATAFRASVLPRLADIARQAKDVWLDLALWGEGQEDKRLIENRLPDGRMLHVGVKGMPGAANLGVGVGVSGGRDNRFETLRAWLGVADSREYMNLPRSAWANPPADYRDEDYAPHEVRKVKRAKVLS